MTIYPMRVSASTLGPISTKKPQCPSYQTGRGFQIQFGVCHAKYVWVLLFLSVKAEKLLNRMTTYPA